MIPGHTNARKWPKHAESGPNRRPSEAVRGETCGHCQHIFLLCIAAEQMHSVATEYTRPNSAGTPLLRQQNAPPNWVCMLDASFFACIREVVTETK